MQLNTHFAINDPTKSETFLFLFLVFYTLTNSWNIFTVDCLPEKPNYVMPKVKLSEGDVEFATAKLSSVCSKKDVHLGPSEKYPLPKTSSQEYGWIHTALVRLFKTAVYCPGIHRYAPRTGQTK